MTTPESGGGPNPRTGSSGTSIPVRSLTAWALLALAAVIVLFNLLWWIFPPSEVDFLNRLDVSDFANINVIVAPLLALLVATKLGAQLPNARLIGLIALATYAAALLFGALAFLLTIAEKFQGLAGRGGFHGFGHILQGIGGLVSELLLLGLLALAALWTYTIFANLGGRLPALNVNTD